ncbi:MAG: hypothetical protein K8I02_03170, partial [Candidatus Methylomirabilis sp.]|nr:hypothetical protein [Deltaproteobacteria bacterium]
FGAWLSDRGGLVGEGIEREVFGRNLRVLGLDLDSTGDLFWFGGEGETLVGPVSLSGVFIWQQGKVRLDGFGVSADGTPFRVDARVKTEGFLLDAEAAYGVLDGLFVRAWLLMASGNDGEFGDVARGRTYRSFLGITPFITRTNLFFNGGISSALSTRTFSVSGTEGRGFIVPGLTVSWEPLDALYLEYTFAYLRSAEGRAAAGSGRVYGYENDLEASWRPLDWLTLSAEFDHLSTGDFYERDGLPSPRDAWRFVVGADIHL